MTTSLDMIRGRSNIVTMTNNSGGALIAGDVCIQDTTADENVTTTTSAASTVKVFIAAESIGIGAAGKFYESGYCPFVNVSASATRGYFLFTHTVAKQATSSATYASGAFGRVLKAGTTPSAIIYSATAQLSGGVTRSGATTDNHLAVWNGSSADSIKDGGVVPAAASADGWTAGTGTWSYSSADAPTFVISVNNDQTAIIGVGMRIKLTQTTDKYFIVTAVGSFSGGATLITVYGGTDYTLANAAITSPYYSVVKAPFGFPLSPAKWTVETTDTSDRTQTSPVSGTWYNLNSTSITIPIGAWNLFYEVVLENVDTGSGNGVYPQAALSTANNSASDLAMVSTLGDAGVMVRGTVRRTTTLALASKTAYYLNARAITAGSGAFNLSFKGTIGTTLIRAICAYL